MSGLDQFILNNDFEFGSKNYDDDFHTDILFYRASCLSIKEYIGDCHDEIIAFHHDFVSSFYYSHSKTKALCEKILSLLQNDEFYNSFEEKYINSCFALEKCWDIKSLSEIDQYELQYECQKQMYKYCWPFEILQTQYGIEYAITNELKHQNFSEDQIKNILYENELNDNNVYYREKCEIKNICDYINQTPDLKTIFNNSLKYITILLPADLRKRINDIVEKYKFLYYHGYSNRKIPNLYDYVVKIKESLLNPIILEKHTYPDNSKFNPVSQRLLACYRKLSALKSIRRLAQLKNFYYLDNFIQSLADKHNVPESIIRYMTPEEVINFYKTGQYNKEIENRINGMIYLRKNNKERILCVGEDINYYENSLKNDTDVFANIFKGKVACRGFVKGQVLKILRYDNSVKVNNNSIIFTHEGDPDLLPIIKKAGAIVCEQGGITCHMAIIAREYGIPCLIGVGNNVLNSFKNGDYVEVDAINGYLKRSDS